VRHRDAVVFVQRALPSKIEQAECRVAALLNFSKYDTGTDGVDGACRDVDHIALRDRTPVNQLGDGAVLYRGAQFLQRDLVFQSDAYLRIGLGRKDIPGLALAIRHSQCAGESVVRMNLDRQWFAGEQEFEEQSRGLGMLVRPFEPQFANGIGRAVKAAPGVQIADPPRLVNDPHGGKLGRHKLSRSMTRTPGRRAVG
jgi:hypothetical protein